MSETAPLRRVLIANRGEIAVRVMRTCRDLGIETIAVFSTPDRTAAHVLYADRAEPIGGAAAADSYLQQDQIIAACKAHKADAVHPGYGFLSENAEFAQRCATEGIVFIGPPVEAIQTMASKTQARSVMESAGVPVVPGFSGSAGKELDCSTQASAAAANLGFPVLIKASAGGGGKGMRSVAQPTEFARAFEAAQREAQAAFGNSSVYIEKQVIRPRHVEIQIFADQHGNVVHLAERDCSIQRRHQKVIEEAPCPVLHKEVREQMCKSAVDAARACNYVGAGTVEFLLTNSRYYFLEMNTRLQVEHPITEMVHGVDLVAWQLEVARGKPLPLSQTEIDERRRGAAIECRIYAEDPEHFLPSPGVISSLSTPSGPYIRDDSGIYEGCEVTSNYDPLLSKLVAWGDTREQALARMQRALSEYRVVGIQTNLPLHQRVLREPEFMSGEYDTSYLERHKKTLCGPSEATGTELSEAVAAALVAQAERETPAAALDSSSYSQEIGDWRRAMGHWHSRS